MSNWAAHTSALATLSTDIKCNTADIALGFSLRSPLAYDFGQFLFRPLQAAAQPASCGTTTSRERQRRWRLLRWGWSVTAASASVIGRASDQRTFPSCRKGWDRGRVHQVGVVEGLLEKLNSVLATQGGSTGRSVADRDAYPAERRARLTFTSQPSLNRSKRQLGSGSESAVCPTASICMV